VQAKANGTKSGKAIGRPAIPEAKRQRIRNAYTAGDVSLRKLAKQFNVSPATVLGIVRK
jgi:predicted DNA binding protein